MNKNQNIKKLVIAIIFIIWSAIVLSVFYIAQRPLVFQVISGIAATFWCLILALILLINSLGFSYYIFNKIDLQLSSSERLILGAGLGLGIMGLTGYGLAAIGFAKPFILLFFLFGILVPIFILKIHKGVFQDFHSLMNLLKENSNAVSWWVSFFVYATCVLGFFFSLLPPADGFDGLFYHLRLPELLLADGKILPYNVLQFWFPSLLEGDFIWALGLSSERTAQVIHWLFSILTLLLIWTWSYQVFGIRSAWWSLVVIASMPSLTWLSSWAYTDLALTFFGLATLYTIWKWTETRISALLSISGVFAGMAMGVKYTSFTLPIISILLILFYERNFVRFIVSSIKYSLPALLIASPWYLRNWIIMGNPFYPFLFGGRYWDIFLNNWYSGVGTGIGWNIDQILLVPFTMMAGYRDRNYFDGRFGPLFLSLLPLAVWVIWNSRYSPNKERNSLLIISSFIGVNYLLWVLGVIQKNNLWQSRLLFPALIPFAIPIGVGITKLDILDHHKFRFSYIINVMIFLTTAITLLDNTLSLIARRPLSYSLGIESRTEYFQRIQSRYFDALELTEKAPVGAYIYFFKEPRSYNMPRKVQPDPLNNNLFHDFYLFKDTKSILNDWKSKGYTHILVYTPAIDEVFLEPFNKILPHIELIEENLNYRLYVIKY